MYTITHLGKTLNTAYWHEISESEYQEIVSSYYSLPDFSLVKKQLLTVANGGSKLNYVNHYYFRNLMSEVKINYNKWTIKEVMNHKPLVEHFVAKSEQNTTVYPTNWSNYKKIYKLLGLGGKGVCSPPTQFPFKVAKDIIQRYNVNGMYYDFSCGWGVRMLAAMVNNVTYIGTDPNDKLQHQLELLKTDYSDVTGTNPNVSLRCCGSEVYQKDLENKIGLAFSSPPYFDLEDYKFGNQSYNENTTYENWLSDYVRPTLYNIYKYLIDGGYLIFNIKNTKKHDLCDDWINIAKECGFKFICIENMKNHHRSFGTKNGNGKNNEYNNDENLFIFQKEEKTNI